MGEHRPSQRRKRPRKTAMIKSMISLQASDDTAFVMFVHRFRMLIAKTLVFPIMMSWHALQAWPGLFPDAAQLQEYQRRWVDVSAEILTYMWANMATCQAIFVLKDLLRRRAMHKQRQRKKGAKDTEDPSEIGSGSEGNQIEYP